MKLKIALYTTTKSNWAFKEASDALPYIAKTKGIENASVRHFKVKLPKQIPLKKDSDGDMRLDFDWLQKHIFKGTGYNVNALHISTSERKKYGLSKHINGTYNRNIGDTSMEFVVVADKGKKAKNYTFSEFTRIFLHELSHGFDHWTGGDRSTTHHYDYDLKKIDKVFEEKHSFEKWNLLKKIFDLAKSLWSGTKKQTLFSVAKDSTGVDASPDDLVDDVVGCAESVSNLVKKILPDFPVITGTWTLWDTLKKDKRFKSISPLDCEPGDIIISPTGTVKGAKISGHVGIVSENDKIMSNNSYTGIFEENYTISAWYNRYAEAGYPVYYYRLI